MNNPTIQTWVPLIVVIPSQPSSVPSVPSLGAETIDENYSWGCPHCNCEEVSCRFLCPHPLFLQAVSPVSIDTLPSQWDTCFAVVWHCSSPILPSMPMERSHPFPVMVTFGAELTGEEYVFPSQAFNSLTCGCRQKEQKAPHGPNFPAQPCAVPGGGWGCVLTALTSVPCPSRGRQAGSSGGAGDGRLETGTTPPYPARLHSPIQWYCVVQTCSIYLSWKWTLVTQRWLHPTWWWWFVQLCPGIITQCLGCLLWWLCCFGWKAAVYLHSQMCTLNYLSGCWHSPWQKRMLMSPGNIWRELPTVTCLPLLKFGGCLFPPTFSEGDDGLDPICWPPSLLPCVGVVIVWRQWCYFPWAYNWCGRQATIWVAMEAPSGGGPVCWWQTYWWCLPVPCDLLIPVPRRLWTCVWSIYSLSEHSRPPSYDSDPLLTVPLSLGGSLPTTFSQYSGLVFFSNKPQVCQTPLQPANGNNGNNNQWLCPAMPCFFCHAVHATINGMPVSLLLCHYKYLCVFFSYYCLMPAYWLASPSPLLAVCLYAMWKACVLGWEAYCAVLAFWFGWCGFVWSWHAVAYSQAV